MTGLWLSNLSEGALGALFGAVVGSFIPLGWSWGRRRVERRGEINSMLAECFRTHLLLRELVAANVAAPLYRFPVSMTMHSLPKLIGDGALEENQVYALIEWVNRIEELNRGLDLASQAAAAHDPLIGAVHERNVDKAREITEQLLERHGNRTLWDAAETVLLFLEEGGPMRRLARGVKRWLNALGLTIGVVGVAFVWTWGWPQPSFGRGILLAIDNGPAVAQHDMQVAALEARYRLMSTIGMELIVAGYICQLLGEATSKMGRK